MSDLVYEGVDDIRHRENGVKVFEESVEQRTVCEHVNQLNVFI